jgi:hypothetical protein
MASLPFLLLGVGAVCGHLARRWLPLSGTAALLLTALPLAGLGLAGAFC